MASNERICLSQQDFNFIKIIVSEYFKDRKLFGMLMVLYKDLLREPAKLTSTSDLLNALEESDILNNEKITLLYDTINLTEHYRLQRLIQESFPSFPNVNGKEITSFTSYRQKLVRFGFGLVERDVTIIDEFFNSTPKKYTDTWTMIRHLEYKQIITKRGLNDFINKLESLGLKQAVLELKKGRKSSSHRKSMDAKAGRKSSSHSKSIDAKAGRKSSSHRKSVDAKADSGRMTKAELDDRMRQLMSRTESLTGKPEKIIDFKDGKLVLREEVLKKILMQLDVKDEPVIVLSIVGALRKGKSFLLNLFIKYLSSNCSSSWMDDKDSELNGFQWGGGAKAITSGIWMWSELFSITGLNGEKIRVALIDTQGILDHEASCHDDSLMFGLNAALSSIQIYNAVGDIDEGDMRFLEQSIRHGMSIKENLSPFQLLLFLVRDWQFPKSYSFGEHRGERRIKDKLSKGKGESRQAIKKGFEEVNCFLLSHPGKKVAQGESFGSFRDMDEEFLEHIDELVKMMHSLLSKQLISKNDAKTCEGLYNHVKTLMNNTEASDFKVYRSTEANAKTSNYEVFNEMMKKYGEILEKKFSLYQNKPDKIFEDVMKSARSDFNVKCFYNKSEIFDTLCTELERRLQVSFQKEVLKMNLTEANCRMLNERAFETGVRIFTTEMNQRCSTVIQVYDLDRLCKSYKEIAIQHFKKEARDFGPSYNQYLQLLERRLEENILFYFHTNQLYFAEVEKQKQHYQNLKIMTFKEACMKYQEIIYQKPFDFDHTKAKEQALAFYKWKVGAEMDQTTHTMFEGQILVIRKNFETDLCNRNETARLKNEAEHDAALLFYRDEMAKECRYLQWFDIMFVISHNKLRTKAIEKYEQCAIKGFESYSTNRENLGSSIDKLKEIIVEHHRTFFQCLWALFNWEVLPVLVPLKLLKNKNEHKNLETVDSTSKYCK